MDSGMPGAFVSILTGQKNLASKLSYMSASKTTMKATNRTIQNVLSGEQSAALNFNEILEEEKSKEAALIEKIKTNTTAEVAEGSGLKRGMRQDRYDSDRNEDVVPRRKEERSRSLSRKISVGKKSKQKRSKSSSSSFPSTSSSSSSGESMRKRRKEMKLKKGLKKLKLERRLREKSSEERSPCRRGQRNDQVGF